MTCPNAPKRGHNSDSRRRLECKYCNPTLGHSATISGSRSSSSPSETGGASPVSPYMIPSIATPSANPELTERSEQVLNLLMADSSEKQIRLALNNLIDEAVKEIGTPVDQSQRGHFLCELLEQATTGIREILDASSTAINKFVDSVTARWLPRAVLRVALKSVLNAALRTNPAVEALESLHLSLAGAAMALCPDPDRHPSLEKTCAAPMAKAGLDHGFQPE